MTSLDGVDAFDSFSFVVMNRLCRIPLAIFVLALGAGFTGGLRAQNISTVSPFLPQNGAGGPVTENSPIELRGILAIPGGSLFGLFDPVKKQGGWVKLNEAGRDFTVRSYDAANVAVTMTNMAQPEIALISLSRIGISLTSK